MKIIEVTDNKKQYLDLLLLADEQEDMVDRYLDSAVQAGWQTVTLVHGKGTGALRAALWKELKRDKRIASYRIGRYGEGDLGVTVCELKK